MVCGATSATSARTCASAALGPTRRDSRHGAVDGLLEVEEQAAAHADHRARVQALAGDAATVDEGAVAAAEILDPGHPLLAEGHVGVLARDLVVLEHEHVAGAGPGLATEHERRAVEHGGGGAGAAVHQLDPLDRGQAAHGLGDGGLGGAVVASGHGARARRPFRLHQREPARRRA
jgi:hypothetical protein